MDALLKQLNEATFKGDEVLADHIRHQIVYLSVKDAFPPEEMKPFVRPLHIPRFSRNKHREHIRIEKHFTAP